MAGNFFPQPNWPKATVIGFCLIGALLAVGIVIGIYVQP